MLQYLLKQFPSGKSLRLRMTMKTFYAFLVLGVLFVLPGCAIFNPSASETTGLSDTGKSTLSTPLAIDAIHLDIAFVDRPIDDPLINNEVWQELDQIATLDSVQRSQLNESGILVGVSGSIPPRPLQKILGLKTEITDYADTSKEKNLAWRSLIRRSGGETIVQASSILPVIRLKNSADGEEKILKNAKCVFHVRIERLQDGWCKLYFMPEIHYGYFKGRPQATKNGWGYRHSQQIMRFQDKAFELTLNLGEMVVLGRTGKDKESLGHSFFQSIEGEGLEESQRLIVIRLTNMRKIDPLFTNKN